MSRRPCSWPKDARRGTRLPTAGCQTLSYRSQSPSVFLLHDELDEEKTVNNRGPKEEKLNVMTGNEMKTDLLVALMLWKILPVRRSSAFFGNGQAIIFQELLTHQLLVFDFLSWGSR